MQGDLDSAITEICGVELNSRMISTLFCQSKLQAARVPEVSELVELRC